MSAFLQLTVILSATYPFLSGISFASHFIMKKFISLTMLFTLLTQSTWAQQSCPLTNTKLTDLRASASKLAQKIILSPECRSYQESVNQANADLKNIAEQIAANEEGAPSSGPDLETTALHAVTQLDTISTLFKDKRCGGELVGFLDYVETFVDVATGMAPFLAVYGGPAAMPWVLGPALGGAAVKALVSFFQNKAINMRDPDQSNTFIKNSCSFYNLDLIKSSIDDLQLNRFSRIEEELLKNQEKLRVIESSAPQKPQTDLVSRAKEAEEDQGRIRYLQDSFKADPYEACIYIKAYASKEDGPLGYNMVDRVWSNYEQILKDNPFRLELERNYFLGNLNREASELDSVKCKELGARWLNKLENLAVSGAENLKKRISEEPEVIAYEKWEGLKAKVIEVITVLEAKLKFLQEMTSDGFNIEYSEIIRSHQLVQDSIFDSYKYLVVLKMKGLAEAWLKVKQEDAYSEYKSFFERKEDVEERIHDIQETGLLQGGELVDVCNQLRQTWNSWYNGLVHAKAGKEYCIAFDKVINKLDYPSVQKLCFESNSKRGSSRNSLKSQVKDFEEIKPEADDVAARMQELSCGSRGDISAELLQLPMN